MSISHFFGTDKFNLHQLVTPYVGSKTGFLIYRILVFAFILAGLVISIIQAKIRYEEKALQIYFSFFTNQTYIAIVIYFFISVIYQLKDKFNILQKRYKCEAFNIIIHIFYNILPPLALLVTIVFWSLIAPFLKWSTFSFWYVELNVHQHLLQSVVLLIDWYLMNVPTRLNVAYPTVVVGIIYLIFSQIYHYYTNHWIYGFLDTSNKFWYLIYIGVIIFWAAFSVTFAKVQKIKYNRHTRESEEASENDNTENIELQVQE